MIYDKRYPLESKHFKGLQGRVKTGKVTTTFSWDLQGFEEFRIEMGPYPKNMDWPSVGRKDHSKGYEPGNIAWQEMDENRVHTDPVSLARCSAIAKGKDSWRKVRTDLKPHDQADPGALCERCGGPMPKYDKRGRPRTRHYKNDCIGPR